MPTARFPIVHSEQVWTCRGSSSLYSEVPSWKSLNMSKGTRVLYWDPPPPEDRMAHTHDWKHDLRHWRAVKIDSLYHIFTERSRLRKTEENNSYSHSFSVTSPLLLFPSTIVRCCSIPGTEVQTLIYFWGKTTTFPHPDPYDQRYKRHSLPQIPLTLPISMVVLKRRKNNSSSEGSQENVKKDLWTAPQEGEQIMIPPTKKTLNVGHNTDEFHIPWHLLVSLFAFYCQW